MIRVAFCCHGNICRSTLSESVFTHKVNALGLGDQFIIDSFATSREEIGNPPHRGTVNKLREVGIPLVPHRATTEAPESTSIADKNINIEAKGVDVKLEITGDSYNISISAPEGQESQIQPVNEVSTVNAPESTTEPQRSPNWVEYITMLLLAVLVGLEIKDKLHKEK